uniref:Uncharacterized protein n=1 Tax=Arundo donax TaxID=35708 RepID=A0A0A9HXH8_ARUDO
MRTSRMRFMFLRLYLMIEQPIWKQLRSTGKKVIVEVITTW